MKKVWTLRAVDLQLVLTAFVFFFGIHAGYSWWQVSAGATLFLLVQVWIHNLSFAAGYCRGYAAAAADVLGTDDSVSNNAE